MIITNNHRQLSIIIGYISIILFWCTFRLVPKTDNFIYQYIDIDIDFFLFISILCYDFF